MAGREQGGEGFLDGLGRRGEAQTLQGVEQVGVVRLLLLSLRTSRLRAGSRLSIEQDRLTAHADHCFPDFKTLFASLNLLPQVIVFVLALTFVDGTESLATIQAVDRIDPFHRKSSAGGSSPPHGTVSSEGACSA